MVIIEIIGGPSFSIDWTKGMNGQTALQKAYDSLNNQGDFTYSLQYYGLKLGYLVDMINETYDTFISKYHPYFFWQFLVNGSPSETGIDQTPIHDGDIISFRYIPYTAEKHESTSLEMKYKLKTQLFV